MSLKENIQPAFKILLPAAKIAAAGLGWGFLGVAGVTARNHRELTHRSITVNPRLAALIDAEMAHYSSSDPRFWAAVHRDHHRFADANLAPEWRIVRAIDWATANPDLAQGVIIPDSFQSLDHSVDVFPLKDVLEIGHIADNIMRDRLGRSYESSPGYTKDELRDVLNPTKPMYFYRLGPRHVGEYTQDDIAERLLSDPHSPFLIPLPEQNGVRGVALNNVRLYQDRADFYRARPDLMPKDLQNENRPTGRKFGFGDTVRGAMIPAVLTLLVRGKYEPKDFLKAALAGWAIYGIKIGLHIFGGNVTNSLGHAGVMTPKRFRSAILSDRYRPILNPDGTVSTDSVNGGLLGQFISMFTFDEVGGQREHHLDPGKIAFTSKEGMRAWMEAPWGSLLAFLARSKYFPLISEGPGFELKDGQTRPDEPNPAMEIIHRCRTAQSFNVNLNFNRLQ